MFLGDCVTEYESCEDKKNRLSQVNRRENTNWIVWHINPFQAKPSPSLQWELWPEVRRGEVGPEFSFPKHDEAASKMEMFRKMLQKGRGGRGVCAILLSHPKMWYGWTHVRPDQCCGCIGKCKSRTGSFLIRKNIVPDMKYFWSRYDFLSGVTWAKPS